MKEKEFVTAIVLAAGRGTRMGTKIPKTVSGFVWKTGSLLFPACISGITGH